MQTETKTLSHKIFVNVDSLLSAMCADS